MNRKEIQALIEWDEPSRKAGRAKEEAGAHARYLASPAGKLETARVRENIRVQNLRIQEAGAAYWGERARKACPPLPPGWT